MKFEIEFERVQRTISLLEGGRQPALIAYADDEQFYIYIEDASPSMRFGGGVLHLPTKNSYSDIELQNTISKYFNYYENCNK